MVAAAAAVAVAVAAGHWYVIDGHKTWRIVMKS